MTAHDRATIIVVHGAWADGSSWNKVMLPLQRRGLRVVAAPIPLTSLSDDAAALARALVRTRGPLVLAAHAYAGAVIATVHDPRVRALVYVAALAPDEGETVAQVFYRDPSHELAPKLAPDGDGFIWMPEEGFRNAFAQNASAEELALAAAVQRPISVRCIQDPAPKPAWRSKPTWFLIAKEDRMINPATQEFMATRMGATVRPLSVDHTPLLTAPDAVVDLIMEAEGAARHTSLQETTP